MSNQINYMVMTIFVLFGLIIPSKALARSKSGCTIAVGQPDTSRYPQITVYVSATNADGAWLTNLSMSDFQITEDGQPAPMADFAGVGQSRPVNVVYVFDTTGSMEQEIDGGVETSIAFAEALQSKGREYRLGLVTFADTVLDVYTSDDTLMRDVGVFKSYVRSLVADGGNNDQENDYGALRRAAQMKFLASAQIIFILITDAPPHHFGDAPDGGKTFNDSALNKDHIVALLKKRVITVYAVTPNETEFVDLATETDGDFTDIIRDIGETIAAQYGITSTSPRPTYERISHKLIDLINLSRYSLRGSSLLSNQELQLVPFAGRSCAQKRVFAKTAVSRCKYPQTIQESLLIAPACGKPLCPEAKFCGGCGAVVM